MFVSFFSPACRPWQFSAIGSGEFCFSTGMIWLSVCNGDIIAIIAGVREM